MHNQLLDFFLILAGRLENLQMIGFKTQTNNPESNFWWLNCFVNVVKYIFFAPMRRNIFFFFILVRQKQREEDGSEIKLIVTCGNRAEEGLAAKERSVMKE